MHIIDWLVLFSVIVLIVSYGIWKAKGIKSTNSFLKGETATPWWTIGLSIMATQASAITFLSTPGQAYDDGLRFVQFYFGLPIAMVLLCIFVLPTYYKLNVFTAYEYLENRFDLKIRVFTAALFLLQRGIAAGLTIFAPSIILSSILGWDLNVTNIIIGILVIIYTVSGGTVAVSQTQKQQMLILLIGLVITFFIILSKLPENVSLMNAMDLADGMRKLEMVDYKFDVSNRYNIWSALLGGTFLFLAYFGTDQSQVQRYLSGKSLRESQLGLLFNGLFKIPMQLMILCIGVMIFLFYQFNEAPLHFNEANEQAIKTSTYAAQYEALEIELKKVENKKKIAINKSLNTTENTAIYQQEINASLAKEKELRVAAKNLINNYAIASGKKLEKEDTDYVFISFITKNLPIGLIGLLLAVIICAAMSSTASELNALASTSMIDFYKRIFHKEASDQHYLKVARICTFAWGVIAILCSMIIELFDNLIEAVNMIGSMFYGVILGIFMIAFLFKKIKGRATLLGAIIGQGTIFTLFILGKYEIVTVTYLWFNLIGCVVVVTTAYVLQLILQEEDIIEKEQLQEYEEKCTTLV